MAQRKRSASRRPVEHRVVLVHGIRTDGPWFAPTVERLRPFFDCVEYGYDGYAHAVWGAVRVAFTPRVLLASLIAAIVAALLALRSFDALYARLLFPAAVLAIGLCAARLAADRQLTAAINEFARFYDEELHHSGRPPHLIAHSLGTYLAGNATARFSPVRFNRIVYCAAVVRRNFDWKAFTSQGRVRYVRNETGLKDPVPLVTALLSLFGREFGSAGLHGFEPKASVVHSVPEQDRVCPSCVSGRAPVHNLPLPFEHSDYFEGGLQCEEYWLPFLLGYDPVEYRLLADMCCELESCENLGMDEARDEIEAQLRALEWSWLQGATLEQAILKRVKKIHPHITHDLAYLVRPYVLHSLGLFWRAIAKAKAERAEKHYSRASAINGSDPIWTLRQCVERAS